MALAHWRCQVVPQTALAPVPSESVGGWSKRGLESSVVATAPEPMRSLHPKSWMRVIYMRERMAMQVDSFGFASSAAALESAQTWRSNHGAAVFLRGQVFMVCTSIDAGRAPLLTFSRNLEVAWFASSQ